MTSVLRLNPAVQNYAWGKVGLESEVAKLFASSSGQPVDETTPYAEVCLCALYVRLCVIRRTVVIK